MIDEQRKELEGKILEVYLIVCKLLNSKLVLKMLMYWLTRVLQLNAEIEEYNKARESEVPLVQEVEAKVKELRQTIPSLNNHQMSLKASIKKMKETAKDMDEKVDLLLLEQLKKLHTWDNF